MGFPLLEMMAFSNNVLTFKYSVVAVDTCFTTLMPEC